MRVTMQDVADRAGVDKATVSRVLRGDHRISEKTKIKVMESVRALDYRLDRNARNLSTKSSGLAGVVVRDLTEPWAGAFVAGLERALSNSGYDVILKSTDGADVRARRAAEALDGLGAEGVIWCDGENFPGALSMPALCFGFTREGFHSLVMEEGGAPSRALTLSFFIGEEHTLPVLSLVTDSPRRFSETYNGAVKYRECAANLSLLAPEGGFSIDCGVELKGRTSLFNPKKSLGVSFRGCYGAETLRYDIFGKGPAEFTELSIRAGQDYISTVFRNELMQELCAELDTTVTQRSRYCVLYINGEYWGIYCLKDDITRQFYANLTGTAKEDVTMLPSPVAQNTAVYTEALGLWRDTSLTRREAYERFCEAMDMDGFIDWVLLEGYCANVDIKSNLRYFRTGDGPWQIAFYDLDWAFQTRSNCFFNLIGPEQNAQIAPTIRWLFGIDDFKERLLPRYAEMTETTLSDEHVTEKIDEFRALLAPEIARERAHWGGSEEGWNEQVDALRANIADDYAAHTVRNLCDALGVGEEERMEYFGF